MANITANPSHHDISSEDEPEWVNISAKSSRTPSPELISLVNDAPETTGSALESSSTIDSDTPVVGKLMSPTAASRKYTGAYRFSFATPSQLDNNPGRATLDKSVDDTLTMEESHSISAHSTSESDSSGVDKDIADSGTAPLLPDLVYELAGNSGEITISDTTSANVATPLVTGSCATDLPKLNEDTPGSAASETAEQYAKNVSPVVGKATHNLPLPMQTPAVDDQFSACSSAAFEEDPYVKAIRALANSPEVMNMSHDSSDGKGVCIDKAAAESRSFDHAKKDRSTTNSVQWTALMGLPPASVPADAGQTSLPLASTASDMGVADHKTSTSNRSATPQLDKVKNGTETCVTSKLKSSNVEDKELSMAVVNWLKSTGAVDSNLTVPSDRAGIMKLLDQHKVAFSDTLNKVTAANYADASEKERKRLWQIQLEQDKETVVRVLRFIILSVLIGGLCFGLYSFWQWLSTTPVAPVSTLPSMPVPSVDWQAGLGAAGVERMEGREYRRLVWVAGPGRQGR